MFFFNNGIFLCLMNCKMSCKQCTSPYHGHHGWSYTGIVETTLRNTEKKKNNLGKEKPDLKELLQNPPKILHWILCNIYSSMQGNLQNTWNLLSCLCEKIFKMIPRMNIPVTLISKKKLWYVQRFFTFFTSHFITFFSSHISEFVRIRALIKIKSTFQFVWPPVWANKNTQTKSLSDDERVRQIKVRMFYVSDW